MRGSRVGFFEAESSNCKARYGLENSAGLALRQSVPTRRRERIVGNLLDLTGNECRAAPVSSKAPGFLAIGIPDVEGRAQHVSAGVVDQVAAQVFIAEENFDVPGEWKDAWIRGDDSVTRLPSATSLALHAVPRERHWNGYALFRTCKLGWDERNDPLLHPDRFVRGGAHHPGCMGDVIDSLCDRSGQRGCGPRDVRGRRWKRFGHIHDRLFHGTGEVAGIRVDAFDR